MKIICSSNFSQSYGMPGYFDNLMTYIFGFQRLGHEVYMMENVDSTRCFDSNGNAEPFEEWEGKHRFESLAKSYGVWPRCCLIYDYGQATHGMSFTESVSLARAADLLVINGGRLKPPAILENVRFRAYVDQNPAKTQVYYAEYGVDYGFEKYDYFFTVGLNIGTVACDIPTGNLLWHGILPPVVLAMWPSNIDDRSRTFTTISTWAGRHTFNFKDRFSGEKADQWRKFIELPKQTSQELEIALNINPGYKADIKLFTDNGWIISDPAKLHTLEDYRRYIANSRAEFSIANNRYVQFNTGWFSDRSARYLASGKPVLVQATGIEDHLPTGKGLLTFTMMEEAVAGIEAINSEYLAHCRAARVIAEEYFDSDKVLSKMLKQIGL